MRSRQKRSEVGGPLRLRGKGFIFLLGHGFHGLVRLRQICPDGVAEATAIVFRKSGFDVQAQPFQGDYFFLLASNRAVET